MPELVKCGGADCFEHMLDLFQAVYGAEGTSGMVRYFDCASF